MQKAQKAESKAFDASDWQIGIVVAQFNSHITDRSLNSVLSRAKDYSIPEDKIGTVKVAGSIEIPLALQALAQTKKYKALVAIGCIIRGETAHFDYVAKFVTDGILRVELDNNIPIAFGVLTCDTEEQALARTHLGGEHLDAAMQLAKSIESIAQ